MNALASFDARKAQVVELRYFGGLIGEETAEVLKTSSATVMRDGSIVKAWRCRGLTNVNSPGAQRK
jgi:RNA polymerase sigma-70 factor (ECF subfamily)